jgi:hypothetical protein
MIYSFLGYNILQSQIIGVGPLYSLKHTDMATAQLYNPIKFYFEVVLLNHTIKIESDWFNLYGPQNEKQDRTDKYNKLKADFIGAIEAIIKLLEEKEK